MLLLENEKKEDKKLFQELGERNKRNFFRTLEEGSKKRKRISGENDKFVENKDFEKKYCMDAILTTNSEKLSEQRVYLIKRKGKQEKKRTENVQLGEEEENKLKMGKSKKIHDLFENKCNKAVIDVLLPSETEQLRADSDNKKQGSKVENLASV